MSQQTPSTCPQCGEPTEADGICGCQPDDGPTNPVEKAPKIEGQPKPNTGAYLPFVLSGNPDASPSQWPIYCSPAMAAEEIEAWIDLALENAEVTVADPHGNPVTIRVTVEIRDH